MGLSFSLTDLAVQTFPCETRENRKSAPVSELETEQIPTNKNIDRDEVHAPKLPSRRTTPQTASQKNGHRKAAEQQFQTPIY